MEEELQEAIYLITKEINKTQISFNADDSDHPNSPDISEYLRGKKVQRLDSLRKIRLQLEEVLNK